MIRRLRCTNHKIVAVVDTVARTRSFEFPAGARQVLCGLMLSKDPQPGQLHVTDESGLKTERSCEVEEVVE